MTPITIETIKKDIKSDEIVTLLRDLVALPSYEGIQSQEAEVAKRLDAYFIEHEIESELIEVVDGRPNIIAVIRGNPSFSGLGRNLLLTGHTDTVPPYGMENPLVIKQNEGVLYGRGVLDMKGALACMAIAMKTIKNYISQGYHLTGDLYFIGVIDEEHKSEGTRALVKWLQDKNIRLDGAIVGEPSNDGLCIGHRGLEWFEVSFLGKVVHGGKQFEGINAIEMSRKFMNKLDEMVTPKLRERVHPVLGPSTINYAVIQGGTQPSTVAGECTLKLDRRWIPGETIQSVRAELEEVIEILSFEDSTFNAKLEVMKESYMEDHIFHEYMSIDENHEMVKQMDVVSEKVLGKKLDHTGFLAWTDAGILSTYGKIDTVVYGPGDMKSAHSKEEHISEESLINAAEIYTAFALEFCK